MFFRNKRTKEDQEKELIEQSEKIKLYKEHIELVHSKIFEYIKHICMLIFVVNGTIILTAINLGEKFYNGIALECFFSLIILFGYIFIIFGINIFIFEFLYSKKLDGYIQRGRLGLMVIFFFTFILIGIQFALLFSMHSDVKLFLGD